MVATTLSAVLIVSSSCSDPSTPITSDRLPGIFASPSSSPALAAPDTVAVNVPFSVTVTTAGGGCTLMGETETSVTGLTAEIRPFDYYVVQTAHVACTADFAYLPHKAAITLVQTGRATLRAYGRTASNEAVVLERTVVVR